MKFKKRLLLLPALLLAASSCNAHPFDLWASSGGGGDDWDWVVFFLLLISPFIVAPVMAILCYSFKNVVLQVFGWITTGIALVFAAIASQLITNGLPFGIAALCVGLMVAGITRRSKNDNPIALYLLCSVFFFAAFTLLLYGVFALLLFQFYGPGVELFALVLRYGFLTFLMLRIIKLLNARKILVTGWQKPLLWSLIVGGGCYFFCLVFFFRTGSVIRSMPLLMILTEIVKELAGCVVAGLVAYGVNRNIQKTRQSLK